MGFGVRPSEAKCPEDRSQSREMHARLRTMEGDMYPLTAGGSGTETNTGDSRAISTKRSEVKGREPASEASLAAQGALEPHGGSSMTRASSLSGTLSSTPTNPQAKEFCGMKGVDQGGTPRAPLHSPIGDAD